ncbi:hypothetical protein ACED56_07330 [Vibrio splendidus]|jgi:hypothetical protein|uniref:Uncharacterized protein n=1 Tax=Vibrio syngnathi TaxID=3034029 RepID=A0AA34XN98_9VIBR|nr:MULTISPECIES: hypothetical protein [Vibrio]ARP38118.1 hypothetical protein K08M4_13630 [Vibrio syngnathi]MDH6016539.1 hypothetical protein [Vibrio splendidus]PMK03046.1 hypothetical protein BCU10_23640 [Vibrio splendidus]PMO22006.1 hypothetical protein BCT15_13765 [Vibrio splendidus]
MSGFERTVELLMQEEVICNTAYSAEFAFLTDNIKRSEVDQYLRQIGRSLEKTSDNLGYLMVFSNLDDSAKKRRVTAQFKKIESELSTLVDWLCFARNIDENSNPISAGERITESELLAAIEASRPLAEQLTSIANKLGRSIKSREVKRKLTSVLNYLTDTGYFVQLNTTGSVYEATAKWSFLYDVLEFYNQRHAIDTSEQSKVTLEESQQQLEL